MDRFVIEGGHPLKGAIQVSGAKNAVLPVLTAALLVEGRTEVTGVPDLRDVHTIIELLRTLGAQAAFADHTVTVDAANLTSTTAPYELVKTMRASIYVLGPLLARFGRARVSMPGGCAWGPRPVDLHLKAMEALGATVTVEHGYIEARAGQLQGCEFFLEIPSVGATGNMMMAASLARGTTVIENAAREPDIECLGDFLSACGVPVRGQGTSRVEIQGVERLRPAAFKVIPDRIEAATFLAAGAVTGSTLRVLGARPDHMRAAINKLEEAGAQVMTRGEEIVICSPQRLSAVRVTTAPYPGFPTDMQAQMIAVLSLAHGQSTVTDTIYHDRWSHVPELQRLGADVRVQGNVAVVNGSRHLTGAPVMATDIRASAALVLAGLAADGETTISRVYHLDRGYEGLERKLAGVGAVIRRDKDPAA
ncbi:MAG TPA: UDP-N-acetylglucosamine 1-carboxyvinyltransferase [Candidatus Saccharimonadales bacterium]|nr:UDP-N-acetylglucosamine 1-carboxyvinyltransferase [Candidatus Saccharimonadales bacterium]